MRAEFVNPFLAAVVEVLEAELGTAPERGPLRLVGSRVTPGELTVAIGVTGDVEGTVLYGMSEFTARRIVADILGKYAAALPDELVESGVAELGNMITGRATMLLEASGYRCDVSPPTVFVGRDVFVSTVEFRRLVIPLVLPQGHIEVHVALEERAECRGAHPLRRAQADAVADGQDG